jgi:hypothetical protein
MIYDYKEGKKRIEDILNNSAEIKKSETIPKDDSNFTYDNGIRSWIGSIFVDIIGSKKLIQNQKDIIVAKVLRSFTAEIITIMNSSANARQIGVRGDCVYGVFSTPYQSSIYELMDISSYINTMVKMLNKLLTKKGYPNISVGIGVAVGEDLIIKAGAKGTGINDRIWIGEAVVDACVLADKAGRNGKATIGYSSKAYENFIEELEKGNANARSWFYKNIDYSTGKTEYYGDIIDINFNKWIIDNIQ